MKSVSENGVRSALTTISAYKNCGKVIKTPHRHIKVGQVTHNAALRNGDRKHKDKSHCKINIKTKKDDCEQKQPSEEEDEETSEDEA